MASSLAALHASHGRCRLAVFPELLHIGVLTPWLGFRPPHVPRLAKLAGCSLDPETTGKAPCLARYISYASWVESAGLEYFNGLSHSGPSVAVHMRKFLDNTCGGGLVPSAPCCQPHAEHIVSRFRNLGILAEGSPPLSVILMLDGSAEMLEEGRKICEALPGHTCGSVPATFIAATAKKAHRNEDDAAVMVDMFVVGFGFEPLVVWPRCSPSCLVIVGLCLLCGRFLAEQADYFIGTRLSTLTCVCGWTWGLSPQPATHYDCCPVSVWQQLGVPGQASCREVEFHCHNLRQ